MERGNSAAQRWKKAGDIPGLVVAGEKRWLVFKGSKSQRTTDNSPSRRIQGCAHTAHLKHIPSPNKYWELQFVSIFLHSSVLVSHKLESIVVASFTCEKKEGLPAFRQGTVLTWSVDVGSMAVIVALGPSACKANAFTTEYTTLNYLKPRNCIVWATIIN